MKRRQIFRSTTGVGVAVAATVMVGAGAGFLAASPAGAATAAPVLTIGLNTSGPNLWSSI